MDATGNIQVGSIDEPVVGGFKWDPKFPHNTGSVEKATMKAGGFVHIYSSYSNEIIACDETSIKAGEDIYIDGALSSTCFNGTKGTGAPSDTKLILEAGSDIIAHADNMLSSSGLKATSANGSIT